MVGSAVFGAAGGNRASASTLHSSAYADPGVLTYGDAQFYGAPTQAPVSSPVVGMAPTPDGKGYWLAAADGSVLPYGDASYYGSASHYDLAAPIVAIASTPDGKGYWLTALDGGVFAFGDAAFHGSTGGIRLNQPIVGMASTSDGKGYWLVATDGGIFAFGDAHFYGSTGGITLDEPVVSMAPSPKGDGYWLVAADGGMFSFGATHFFGSLGDVDISSWITGMAPTKSGNGYWLANADGEVYHFGDAVSYGDDRGAPRTQPIVSMVATPDSEGYWLLEPDAFPTAFTHPASDSRIVTVASGQVGADPDPGYFCNPYGPCEAWCALFATWVWQRAGIPIPQESFVGSIYDWAAAHTAVLPPAARPTPGDFVLFGTGPENASTAVHMGIVAQVWPDGAIDTVEGDAGPGPDGSLNVIINGPFLPDDSEVYNGFAVFAYAVP